MKYIINFKNKEAEKIKKHVFDNISKYYTELLMRIDREVDSITINVYWIKEYKQYQVVVIDTKSKHRLEDSLLYLIEEVQNASK